MGSEIENIQKGVVVETPDYKEYKKIIGIMQSTVQSVDGSVAPLSKQTAFKKMENFEEIGVVEQPKVDSYSVPTLEVPSNEFPSVSQPASNLPNTENIASVGSLPNFDATTQLENPMQELQAQPLPQNQDVFAVETPVQTSNPSVLESLVEDVTSIGKQAANSISSTLEPLNNVQEKPNDFEVPVEMPKLDEPVVAAEPSELNDSLFAPTEFAQPAFDANLEQKSETFSSNPNVGNLQNQSNVLSSENTSNDILKIIELRKSEISGKIANYMTAASNMLIDEIIEIIKLEMQKENLNAIQEELGTLNNSTSSNVNDSSSLKLNL